MKKYTHNLTVENLIKTFKLGGIVCPSVAYSDQDMNFFGEVELVFNEDFLKENGFYKNYVYAYRIDAYTGVVDKNLLTKEELYSVLSKQLTQNTECKTQGDEIDLFLANQKNNPRLFNVKDIEELKFISREERIEKIAEIQYKNNVKRVEDLICKPAVVKALNEVHSDYAELKLDLILNYHDKELIKRAIKEVNIYKEKAVLNNNIPVIQKVFSLYEIAVKLI